MLMPKRRRLKTNGTSSRQPCGIDVPTLQLSPIIDWSVVIDDLNVGNLGSLAAHCSQRCHRRHGSAAFLRLVWTADNAMTKFTLIDTEDRTRRNLAEAPERGLTVVGYA